MIPFEEFFAPWIEEARRRLPRDAGAIAPEALRDLERWLARRLSGFAAQALGAAFDRFRGGRPDGFAVRLAEAGVGRETRLYRAFLGILLADGHAAWTVEFPVLDKLMARAVDLWVDRVRDLLADWREDAPEVRREILGDGPIRKIARIEAGLSDAHAGGRTVHVLVLEDGARVVYKPRSLGMDVAFARWLSWCNERGAASGLLDFFVHRLLDRGDRGWAEFVAAEPCPDREAARRFHLRAGQLLALLHASGARDAHFENLVAHGEHPVLIDLEAWLPPRLARWLPAEGDEGWIEAALRLEHSVLSTGLLPRWQPDGPRDDVVNVGGLGGGQPATRLRPSWRAVNTDRMVRVWSPVETGVQPNVPRLDGQPLPPEPWAAEVREGFTRMYRFLLSHREELLSSAGPLGDLAGRRGRLIFRPTLAYARLRDRSLRPDACRDAAVRAAALDALDRIYRHAIHPATRPLADAERRALEQGDIPVFHADLAGTVLEGPDGERIPDAIGRPAVEVLADRLRGLGPEDLEEQVGYIEAALGASSPTVYEARPLGEVLQARALCGRDGSLGWIGPRYLARGETFELTPLGADLYGGTAGIALFFAALHRIEGGGWREPALALARQIAASPEPLGIGGLAGLGSRIYALVAVGELLEDTGPIREAYRLAARITPERIAADTWFDVTLGTAGALLALLALQDAKDARDLQDPKDGALPDPLEIAGACARHLVAHRPSQAGFAHGAAGIACALLRFAARTGDAEARQAGLAAIAAERRMEITQTTWCRGWPGIALARLATLDVYDDAEVRQEIQAALATTRASALTPMDHLCCGNLGRAEILLTAGEILGDAGLIEAARELAGRALDRAAERGGLAWLPSGQVSAFDPSFFKGAAGAGYTLLRLAAPERLPCVLRLEPAAGRLQHPSRPTRMGGHSRDSEIFLSGRPGDKE